MEKEPKPPRIIVPGGLNVDLTGLGVERLVGPGELTLGGTLRIGPGGKARNMAQMAGTYLGPGRVAMIGRTSRDPFGLWRVPLRSLEEAGVAIDRVRVTSLEEAGGRLPGAALIAVDRQGRNQIYVLPGANLDFGPGEVEAADALFTPAPGTLVLLALEIPRATVRHCLRKARRRGIPVVLDPGGVDGPSDDLLGEGIFLLKPNEQEAELLTGIGVAGEEGAEAAARTLLDRGVENVLLTRGAAGALFVNREERLRLPAPPAAGAARDETGCGDQVTAIAAASLAEGLPPAAAAVRAVAAGTLQFHRAGIQPLARAELEEFLDRLEEP